MNIDLFSIFNPDWWMDENNNALQIADSILFLFFLLPVLYLFLFSLASLFKRENPYPTSKHHYRFLVLFTVLRDGKEVIESVNHLWNTQDYPRDKYDVAVAATQLSEEDLIELLQMPLNIVIPDKDECSKVYALQQAMERYAPNEYDMVLLLNSDNRISANALQLFNNAYHSGCEAMQAHRVTENLTTNIAVLNAVTEEINNSIFRRGHTRMGFSSALIGSAMAFDFRMFHEIAPQLRGTDVSKTMERELLKQNLYTEYLEDITCYSRKEENTSQYKERHAGWINSQYDSAFYALRKLPWVLLRGEWDYANKLFQWLLPSRYVLVVLVLFVMLVVTTLDWTLALKWYALYGGLILAFLMALPEGELAQRFKKSYWVLPKLAINGILLRYKTKKSSSLKKKNKKGNNEENN